MVQGYNRLTDAGGRMIAEGLKGNCSVTEVELVSAGLLLVRLLLLTCDEQGGNDDISDAVKREIKAFTNRNENEPEQRRAEVAAIKQVFCRFCTFLHNYESSLYHDHAFCAYIIHHNLSDSSFFSLFALPHRNTIRSCPVRLLSTLTAAASMTHVSYWTLWCTLLLSMQVSQLPPSLPHSPPSLPLQLPPQPCKAST